MKLNILEKKILKHLLKGIPFTFEPFEKIAQSLNFSSQELLQIIKALVAKGVIKKIKPQLNYRLLGYQHNALVAWQIFKIEVPILKKNLVKIKNISHCIVRKNYPQFPYNLYTMIHASTIKELNNIIKKCQVFLAPQSFKVFPTLREYKKDFFKYYG